MLKLKLFGSFSLAVNDRMITHESCHSPRVLRALLYIFANRKRRIPLREFSLFLREGKEYSTKAPYSAGSDSLVKTTLYRVRALLDPLAELDPALILHCRDGGIYLDPSLTVDADTDRFLAVAEELAAEALPFGRNDRTLFLYRSLVSLYSGRFLEDFPEEASFFEERERYHTLFTTLSEDCLPLFLAEKAYGELIRITGNALHIDPYFESFHFYKIRATLENGDTQSAMVQYRMAERLFFEKFRINPSERLRRLRNVMLTDGAADSAYAALSTLAAVPPCGTLSWEAFSYLLREKGAKDCFFTLVTLKNIDGALPFPKELIACRLNRLQYAVLSKEESLPESLTAREDLYTLETLPLSALFHKIISETTEG